MNTSIGHYIKLSNKYLYFCFLISLILVLNTNNSALAEEKPLSTIGEPQPTQIKSNVSKPIETNTDIEKPANNTAITPNKPVASPFNTRLPVKTGENVRITPDAIIPEKADPKIEELKTTTTTTTNTPNAPTKSMIADPKNPLGLAHPYNALDQSLELLKKNDVVKAKAIVEPLAEWLTTLTEYHIQLFKKLNEIETAKNQAQVEKRIALDSALLRDKAYYQLGLIYLAEKNEKQSIKYLIEVIKSQPKTELGMKAYEILQQIGFTEKVRLTP